jgi:hypothetical protein
MMCPVDNQRFTNDLPMLSALMDSNTYTDCDVSKDGTIGKRVQVYVCYRAYLPTTETYAGEMPQRQHVAGCVTYGPRFAVSLLVGAVQDGRSMPIHCRLMGGLIEKHARIAAFEIAEVYASRNDGRETFAWLDRAWSNHDPDLLYLRYDPFILRYKHDLRLIAFCRKVGLPTPTEPSSFDGDKNLEPTTRRARLSPVSSSSGGR